MVKLAVMIARTAMLKKKPPRTPPRTPPKAVKESSKGEGSAEEEASPQKAVQKEPAKPVKATPTKSGMAAAKVAEENDDGSDKSEEEALPPKKAAAEPAAKAPAEAMELGARDSDVPEDMSGEESADSMSIIDPTEEHMNMQGLDALLDRPSSAESSDEDWEPETPTPQRKRRRSSLTTASPAEEPSTTPSTTSPPTSPASTASKALPTTTRGGKGRAKRTRGGRGGRSRHTASTSSSAKKWLDVDEADVEPPHPSFRPARTPGPQLSTTESYSPLQLFQLFMTSSMLQTIVNNSNAYGRKKQEGKAQPWHLIELRDMFSFIALVIYMGLTKCHSFLDYWRKSELYNLPLPAKIMSARKFMAITFSLKLSDPKVDAENEKKRGTADFDRLCKIKPMYNSIREACLSNFQPSQDIAIDERMVATKARIGIKQYMKDKPTKWGYKLFVLADSLCGYTWNFFVYEGKSPVENTMGLSYDSVVILLEEKLLGTGYRLFVDNFYTSPELFRDLLKKKIQACGTIRSSRIGFPKTTANALDKNSPRGSMRWIRDGALLFVKWKDTREVSMCSTIHKAFKGQTVQRNLKGKDGKWSYVDIPIPAAVKDYNKNMGGVDLSDALIGYYNVLHKTKKWYRTFFYHFVDIAVVNAFILHKELAKAKNEKVLSHKAFREKLVLGLSKLGSESTADPPLPPRPPPGASHKPIYIADDSAVGRRKCRHCHQKTPLKCVSCDVPLCLVPKRDCYNAWHDLNNL